MRERLYLGAILLFASFSSVAQNCEEEVVTDTLVTTIEADALPALVDTVMYPEGYRDMRFRFIFIDHEPSTPVSQLCLDLIKLQEKGDQYQALMVYLADEDSAFVAFVNLKDPIPEKKRDSEAAFDAIIYQLQCYTSHDVADDRDAERVKALIGPQGIFPLFDEEHGGAMLFKSVMIDFYVGSLFWRRGNNENVIAKVFAALNIGEHMEHYNQAQLSFNVKKYLGEQLYYPADMPFGRSNLQHINEKLIIQEY